MNSLIGCEKIPRNITSGQIEFDHGSTKCSRVNTCTPSIQFSNIDKIQNYEKFEDLMMNFVVGAYGFGCV